MDRRGTVPGLRACACAALAALGLPAAGGADGTDPPPGAEGGGIEEVIVVRGIRGGLRRSARIRRDADGFVDALVEKDVGDFPDQNLAESLQRVPGVAIDRQRGEGATVSVRGLGPRFARVQVNGRTALSTGVGGAGTSGAPTASRAFGFDALQSELVRAVRVLKSPRADLATGGLSGTVDVRTRRPFDDGGGPVLAGSAAAAHGELADRTGLRVSGTLGNTFGETFGALLGVAYDDRRVREDWIGHPDYEPKLFDRAVDGDGDPLPPCALLADAGTSGCGYAPGNVRMGLVEGRRRRLNVSAALQWRPRPDAELTVDALAAEFDRDYLDLQLPLRTQAGLARAATRVELDEHDVVRYLATTSARPRPYPYDHDTASGLGQLGANLAFSLAPRWDISLDAAVAEADVDQTMRAAYYDIVGGAPVTWDARDRFVPRVSVDADLDDPAAYAFAQLRRRLRDSTDREAQFRADAAREFDNGNLFRAGVSRRDRRREYAERGLDVGTRDGVFRNEPMTNVRHRAFPADDFLTGIPGAETWPRGWRWPDPDDVFGTYLGERADEIPEAVFASASVDRAEDFAVREETWAAYAMARFAGEIGGIPVSGNLGLRAVRVERASTGNVQPIADVVYSEAAGTYGFALLPAETRTHRFRRTAWLPSADVRFELRENLLLRAAAGRTMSQPEFDDLNPGGTKQATTRRVEEGNPRLEPLVAEQLDVALEWYPAPDSVFALAAFGKRVDSFVVRATVLEEFVHPETGAAIPDLESGGNVRLQRTSPRNADGAYVGGVELVARHAFAHPSPLAGLGARFNYTRVGTDAEFANPNSGATFDVPGLSRNTLNAVVFYERGPLSARLAWNRRGPFLVSVSDTRSNPRFARAHAQWDAGIAWRLSDAVTLVAEGINLGDGNVAHYNLVGPVSTAERMRLVSNTGRRLQAGVRVSFGRGARRRER